MMYPDTVKQRAERARREQGLPEKVEDRAVLKRVASLLRLSEEKVA